MSRASDHRAFSGTALEYFAAHAIDPVLAAGVGVTERCGSLIYPCVDSEGTFERTRALIDNSGKRTMQPKGRDLACWWPRGRPAQAYRVLVCEGEPDALAALSAIALADGLPEAPKELLEDLSVVAVPGTGFNAKRLVDELRQVGAQHVALASDGDSAGEQFAERMDAALRAAGLQGSRLPLPENADLRLSRSA